MSTAPSCPEITGSDAVGIINDGWVFHRSLITSSFEIANGLVGQLVNATQDPINFAITFDVPSGLLTGFVAPAAPADPGLVFETGNFHPVSDPPTAADLGDVSFKPLPDINATPRGAIAKYNPGQFTTPAPDVAFTPTPVTLPADLSVTNPDAPDLFAITLPDAPVIVLPQFQGQAPEVDFSTPTGNIDFTPRAYSDALLDQTKARISGIMIGGTGIPQAVQDALFAKAMAREDIIARKAVMEATEECAAMGHSLPSGGLMAKLNEVRQNNANNASSASRDIYIKLIDTEWEAAKFCIEKGIALEGLLIDADFKYQDLGLKVEQLKLDASVRIFDSNVQLFNARGQMYAVEAQVFKAQIEGEQLKLETYKAELDAQRLIGEINKDLLARYEAQQRVVGLLIEQYKARWDAVKTITERDNLVLQQQRLKLELFDSQIGAWSKQWDVTIKQYEADAANGRLYESQVNAYAALIRGLTDGNRNLIEQKQLTLRQQELQLTAWGKTLDRFVAEVDAEAKRISAGAQVYDGKARIYAASGEIAKSQSDANVRAVQVLIEGLRAKAEIAVEQLKLQVTQLQQLFAARIEALKGAAATAGQMVAGAASGISFSAHAQDSNSTSTGVECRTTYDLQGSL